ncbi:MAG: hypothetical protein QOF00_1740, partial [Pseudonocardiales bacterium]|nr:hypothetical protein [Pseudonocardiales bacterium]
VVATIDRPVGPAPTAHRSDDGWVVDTSGGPVPVALPQRRPVAGEAPSSGADTAAVLDELGVPAP